MYFGVGDGSAGAGAAVALASPPGLASALLLAAVVEYRLTGDVKLPLTLVPASGVFAKAKFSSCAHTPHPIASSSIPISTLFIHFPSASPACAVPGFRACRS